MDEQLLVRVYDVGFGDCIYVRIPDGEGCFHLLIDCGTSASADPAKNPALKNAVDDVRSMLPLEEDGKRRLDLLVATHPHADHIKGFDPDWFQDVRMKQIWLSAFIQPDHPQAKKMQAFQDAADRAAGALLSRPGLFLAPGARALLQRSIWNPGALKALRTEFAQSSGIFPDYPLYVARDLAGKLSPEQLDRYGLDSEKGTTRFRGFAEAGTSLRVLAPEWDIDKYYLGQGDFDENHALLDARILETDAYKPAAEALDGTVGPAGAEPDGASGPDQPINISASDYRRLKNRLLYSALAFAQKDDALKNNTSVVLLLEWRKKRLLFTGDAEWHGAGVEEDRRNSTWDVMLANPEVEQLLLQPLDVFKVSHHGSHNGTPFLEGGETRVLDRMVKPERTQVVVSTIWGKHGVEKPVPFPDLMRALGLRSANRRRYPADEEETLRTADQPQRTDLEAGVAGKEVRYVELWVEPGGEA